MRLEVKTCVLTTRIIMQNNFPFGRIFLHKKTFAERNLHSFMILACEQKPTLGNERYGSS